MSVNVRFKAVYPKKMMSVDAYRLEFLTALHKAERELKVLFGKTTRTWKRKVQFTSKISLRNQSPTVEVWTDDEIYGYISNGTSVRYATMTNPFVSKTKVKWIGSRKGVGGMLFVSRKHPRPGIKAREFDTTIADRYKRSFAKLLKEAIIKANVKSGYKF